MEIEFYSFLKTNLALLEIELTDKQINQFYNYYCLLTEWNKVMNLTAIVDMESVIIKHFIDSLSLIKSVDDLAAYNYEIIDVGTGAGFPGIPLKIAYPNLSMSLLDSLNKRINFLNKVIEELQLENIVAFHGRAEDYGRDMQHREVYDICLSRAVSNISTLSEYCLPFVKVGGLFIAYKSGEIEDELNNGRRAINMLGGDKISYNKFTLPGNEINRSLIRIMKVKNINKKYPRKSGLPSKEPIV